MAEANGVFVHLFRNKEAWKQNEGLLETAKGKFEAEQEYRKKLAEELNVKRFNELPRLLSSINPDDIFSEIDSDELQAVRRIIDCGSDAFWPQLTVKVDGSGSKYCGHIPTEILDEASFVTSLGMFSDIYIVSNKPDTTSFLVGRRNKNNYLIAYWGPQEVYEKIRAEFVRIAEMKKAAEAAKLAEAEAAKAKEEQAKANKEKNSGSWGTRPNGWDFGDWVGTGFSVLLLFGCFVATWHMCIKKNVPATSEVKNSFNEHNLSHYELSHTTFCNPKGREVEFENLPAGTIVDKGVKLCSKGHSIRMVLVSMDPDGYPLIARVTSSVYDNLQVGDKISHSSATESVRAECVYAQIPKIDSVYKLPTGEIFTKSCTECECDQKKHYFIKFGPNCFDWDYVCVSKDVWDKLKVGDKIPFKRPEY